MTIPTRALQGDIIESIITKGDLSKLTPEERTIYYTQLCRSLGMNPHTQPFAYITLNNKLTLYAKRDAADQLRKIHGISITIVDREEKDGLLTVHVKATDASGRTDEDLGTVAFPETLRGDARANAILKAVTKAKRRVTLSIAGLGFLDELELDSVQAARRPAPPAPNPMLPPHDPETGEIISQAPPEDSGATAAAGGESESHSRDEPSAASPSLEEEARMAAAHGRATFNVFWKRLTQEQRTKLAAIQDELGRLMREADEQSAPVS
jgi:hypothetical protein